MERDFVQRPGMLRKAEIVGNLKRVGLDWTRKSPRKVLEVLIPRSVPGQV